jgi:hypothetical protein
VQNILEELERRRGPTWNWWPVILIALVSIGAAFPAASADDLGNPIFQKTLRQQLAAYPAGFSTPDDALNHIVPQPSECGAFAGKTRCVPALIQLGTPAASAWYAGWTPHALSFCFRAPPVYGVIPCSTRGALRAPKLIYPKLKPGEAPPPPLATRPRPS